MFQDVQLEHIKENLYKSITSTFCSSTENFIPMTVINGHLIFLKSIDQSMVNQCYKLSPEAVSHDFKQVNL